METQTAQGLAAQISHNVSIGDELREQERIQAIGSSISDSSSDVPEDVKGLLFQGTSFTKIILWPIPVWSEFAGCFLHNRCFETLSYLKPTVQAFIWFYMAFSIWNVFIKTFFLTKYDE